MSEWRPIETAPEEAKVLIVSGMGSVWMATYKHVGPRAGWQWRAVGIGRVPFQPTHWMPLPEPPEES